MSVLPVPGADEQDTARQTSAELVILGGVAQEIDDFGQFLFGLFFSGHVSERHLWTLWIMLAGARAPEAEDILLAARHLAAHEHDQADDEQEWKQRYQDRRE